MANNIDFSDVKTQRTIFIIFIGVVIAGLIGFFQIKPQTVKLKELKETSVARQAELDRILSLKPQLERMRIEVADLKRELDSLESIFPEKTDVPTLITDITEVSRAQKITIMGFKPSKAPMLKKEYYIENYYELSVLGSYHNIGNFLAKIANFELLVNIDRVNAKLNPNTKMFTDDLKEFDMYKGEKTSDDFVRSVLMNFRITTYSSLPVENTVAQEEVPNKKQRKGAKAK